MKNAKKHADNPFKDLKEGHILTQAIIDTIQEPLIVLDEELRIIVASRSFYKKFHQTHENTKGKNSTTSEMDSGTFPNSVPSLKK